MAHRFQRLLPVTALLLTAGFTQAATIVVTTTRQGVQDSSVDGTCSFQEAIFSANYDDDVAVNPNDPTHFVVTGCNKGSGDDIIILQPGATYVMSAPTVDPYNPLGATATPLIFSNITIQGNGATIIRTGNANMRAFAVGPATVDLNAIDPGRTVSGTGQLTLNNAYVKSFRIQGGTGTDGGGGGMGAGGAIYLQGGELTVANSTFSGNSVTGGNANSGRGGGGGGLGGRGGTSVGGPNDPPSGGGGGGSVGNGGTSSTTFAYAGGGGGTLSDGGTSAGGFRCGGNGGDEQSLGTDGSAGACPGGGGGGGSGDSGAFASAGEGGNGNYGGGGGGGGNTGSSAVGANGGHGGFGGGGGASGGQGDVTTTDGGDGGFGGGGGACPGDKDHPGTGGIFGGNADKSSGGGGAGLGGAIFSDNGTLAIYNSTFVGNQTFSGLSAAALDGEAHGNAIFSHNGTTTLSQVTVSGNGDANNQTAADVVIEADNATAHLNLSNSILANNNAGGVNGVAYTFSGGSVSQNNSGNLIQNAGFTTGNMVAIAGVVISADPK